MHIFKDKEQREWKVNLDLSKAMEIESTDFAQAFNHKPNEEGLLEPYYIPFLDPEEKFFQTYLTNTRVVFLILWVLCREQGPAVEVHNIEDFAKRFDGESLNAARMAFYEELPSFFPSRQMTLKASIQRYFDAMMEMDSQMAGVVERRMNRGVIQRTVARELAKMEEGMDLEDVMDDDPI